jgi:membrane protease YdiL (CAAX protease family)
MSALEGRDTRALREMLTMWAIAFGAIIVFRAFTSQAKTAATVAFLYLPIWWIDKRQLSLEDFGMTLRNWRADARMLAVMLALVFPPFIGGFFVFVALLPHLPPALVALATPYGGALPQLAFRLPHPDLPSSLVTLFGWLHVPVTGPWGTAVGLVLLVLDQFLVVALSEEFFYRGFMQKRLRETFPEGRVLFGVKFGPAFWITQVLFAVGHLAEFRPWRLAVFFPSILFGIMRERTGTIASSTCFHALCNLAIFTLEASAFPR